MQRVNINTNYKIKEILDLSNKNEEYQIVLNQEIKEDDIIVVLDFVNEKIPIKNVNKMQTILYKCEPSIATFTKKKYIRKFGYYISNHKENIFGVKNIQSLDLTCFQTWIKNKDLILKNDFDLLELKNKNISILSSGLFIAGLQPLRFNFIKYLIKENISWIDIFGFYNKVPIEDALLNYKYTIVLENTAEENHWTEKLTDAMRMKNFIFYHGCKNIDNYFNINSIIKINLWKPEEAIDIIRKNIENNSFEKNIKSIEENFEKTISLSFAEHIIKIIKENNINSNFSDRNYKIKYKKNIRIGKFPWRAFYFRNTAIKIFIFYINFLIKKLSSLFCL